MLAWGRALPGSVRSRRMPCPTKARREQTEGFSALSMRPPWPFGFDNTRDKEIWTYLDGKVLPYAVPFCNRLLASPRGIIVDSVSTVPYRQASACTHAHTHTQRHGLSGKREKPVEDGVGAESWPGAPSPNGTSVPSSSPTGKSPKARISDTTCPRDHASFGLLHRTVTGESG